MAVRRKPAAREVLTGEVVTEPVLLPQRRHAASIPVRHVGTGLVYVLLLVWGIVRTVLFFVLRVLGPFVRLALALVGGFCLLMTIAVLILAWHRGWPESVLWQAGGFFLVAVICSVLSWYYDLLMFKLTPNGYQLTLWS